MRGRHDQVILIRSLNSKYSSSHSKLSTQSSTLLTLLLHSASSGEMKVDMCTCSISCKVSTPSIHIIIALVSNRVNFVNCFLINSSSVIVMLPGLHCALGILLNTFYMSHHLYDIYYSGCGCYTLSCTANLGLVLE